MSVNAYNLWALFPVDGASMATAGGWIFDAPVKDAASWAAIGPVPAALVGAVLLLGTAVIVSLVVARRPDRLTILVGVSVLALAFFVVPTRVHERYLFPLFGLAAILVAFSWRWRIAYAVASVATFLNMYVVLTTIYPDNPSISDWLGIGPAIRSFSGVALIAVLHTVAFAWGFVQLRSRARSALALELAAGREGAGQEPAPGDGPGRRGGGLGPAGGSPAGRRPAADRRHCGPRRRGAAAAAMVAASAAHDPPADAHPPAVRRVPAWYDRPTLGELGPIGWLRARMRETPIRPDRSRQLAREGGGRLDRLDLWILVVLVVASLCLRMYRLDEPARMHFDEVYHARTATEFLQDWRYGISHNIYEWTHPHLAKYAMAGGIVAFAGHDVAAVERPRGAGAGRRHRATARGSRRDVRPGRGPRLGRHRERARRLRPDHPQARRPLVRARGVGRRVRRVGPPGLRRDRRRRAARRSTRRRSTRWARPARRSPRPARIRLARLTAPSPASSRSVTASGWGRSCPATGVAVVDPATGQAVGTLVVRRRDGHGPHGRRRRRARDAGRRDGPRGRRRRAGGASPAGTPRATAMRSRKPTRTSVILDVALTSDLRTKLQTAIDDGRLPGIRIDKTPLLAVTGAAGVDLVTEGGTLAGSVPLDGGAGSAALVSGVDEGTQLYVTTTDAGTGDPQVAVIAVSGDQATNGPSVTGTFALPGAGTRIVYDDVSQLVEVLGETPDGTGTTVYVVEPHGRGRLRRPPARLRAVGLGPGPQRRLPATSRGAILAFDSGGRAASLDVGTTTSRGGCRA